MGYAFFKKVECLCMQGLQISEWSFKEAISGWKIIQYFSFRHKLQRFDAGLYAAPLSIILHLIVYCLPSSFIFQFYYSQLHSSQSLSLFLKKSRYEKGPSVCWSWLSRLQCSVGLVSAACSSTAAQTEGLTQWLQWPAPAQPPPAASRVISQK